MGLGGLGLIRSFAALLGAALLCTSAVAAPQEFHGRVTRVSDGDTLWVQAQPGRKPIKVRLVGIDAPERCQAHGDAASAALRSMALGREVTVRRHATDDYGRALGTLWIDGRDVAATLVREGHAWSADSRGVGGPYAREQAEARAARRGLFAHADPQRPRDFRREHGPCR